MMMTYGQFLDAAQTPAFVAATAKLGTVRRGITWFGVRVGFLCYRLGLSANQVSLLGWALGICGLCLLSARGLPRWSPFSAVACLYAGAFTDFCDGSVARARRSANKLGQVIDGISTDFIRFGFLIALGAVAGSGTFVAVGLVSAYLIVSLRNQFFWAGVLCSDAQGSKPWIRSTLRWAFSVHCMIGALPLIFAVAEWFGRRQRAAEIILAVYLTLALTWFWLSCRGVRKAAPKEQPVLVG